jgi:hypothetical protein
MHTYIDLYFAPNGVSPLEVSEKLKREADLSFVIGPHDLVFEWRSVEEFRSTLARVHRALDGTGVTYRVQTVTEEPGFVAPSAWPPPLSDAPDRHPGYRDQD